MGLLDELKSAAAAAAVASTVDVDGQAVFAPSWRWEKAGDGVEGTVVVINSRINENNPEGYPIVTLRQADGTDIAVHGFATVLKNEINERNPQPGDMFAVLYDGKKTSGSGRQFHAFRFAHQPGKGGPILAAAVTAAPAAVPIAPPVPDPWVTVASNGDIPPF